MNTGNFDAWWLAWSTSKDCDVDEMLNVGQQAYLVSVCKLAFAAGQGRSSQETFDAAARKAYAAMEDSSGHVFEHCLKVRCVWCRRSPRAKGRCGAWFQTFLWHLRYELTGVYGVPKSEEVEK